MSNRLEAVSVEGLKGKKWSVRKVTNHSFLGLFKIGGSYWMIVDDDGTPIGYSEYYHNAWRGTKKQAEKLIRLETP